MGLLGLPGLVLVQTAGGSGRGQNVTLTHTSPSQPGLNMKDHIQC